MTAIAAHDISYRYPDRKALDGVSFDVGEGELFAFLGPNGSGKSTLFRLLTTAAALQEGELELLGRDPGRHPRAVRRRIGVVFQSPSLDPQLTVIENLALHGRLHGLRRSEIDGRTDALLGRFRIADRRRDRVSVLSGGLRRRVELAKTLVPSPELLLLDEPSTGLDPRARRELWDILERLRREDGVTVVLTTHFMEEADRCDRIVLLHRGLVVSRGTPAELKGAVGVEVVAVSTRAPERLLDHLEERLGPGLDAWIHGETVTFVPVDGDPTPVVSLLDELPELVEAVTVARPTLEDVFIRATGEGLE